MQSYIKMLLALSLSGTALGMTVLITSKLLKKKLPAAAVYVMWLIVSLRLILPLPGLIGFPGDGGNGGVAMTKTNIVASDVTTLEDYGETASEELSANSKLKSVAKADAGADITELESIYVTDLSGLFAALGSNREITLVAGEYLISDASGYGDYVTPYSAVKDASRNGGSALSGIRNLTLIGEDGAIIVTEPRSANVITLVGCDGVTLENAGLFGCGVNGINAIGCQDLFVTESEIYECSGFAVVLKDSFGTSFDNVYIRDCEYNYISSNAPVKTENIKY